VLFRNFYEIVVGEIINPPVKFVDLMGIINVRHKGVGEIKVYPIKYPSPNRQAHYKLIGTDRTSAYDDEFDIAEIRYCDQLDESPIEKRFTLTKELMHVFDTDNEKVNTREKFVNFLKEIQNKPLSSQRSEMFNSEIGTRWMAAIILCPKPFRDKYLNDYRNGGLKNYEVSENLGIPEWVIPSVMSDYYDTAFDFMMAKGS
jgi:hypothetical protein